MDTAWTTGNVLIISTFITPSLDFPHKHANTPFVSTGEKKETLYAKINSYVPSVLLLANNHGSAGTLLRGESAEERQAEDASEEVILRTWKKAPESPQHVRNQSERPFYIRSNNYTLNRCTIYDFEGRMPSVVRNAMSSSDHLNGLYSWKGIWVLYYGTGNLHKGRHCMKRILKIPERP